jgi:hypothetical protein
MKALLGCLVRLSVVLVLLGCAQSLYADDVVTGFSSTTNPNGVWTYEYDGTAFSSGQAVTNFVGSGLSGWYDGEAEPNAIYILQNVTGSNASAETIVDPTGTLWMDPEGGNVSVMFTAPAAGTYTITGDFLGIDTGENSHPVDILDNGTGVLSGTISSYGQDDPFSFPETLSAGDTITFYVGTGSTGCAYCNLSTGLDGTITESSVTPEPSSLTLFGSGLLALAYLLRRKRRAQS